MVGMRVVITGGFGFMGAWLAEYYTARGSVVFILSRSNVGKIFHTPILRQTPPTFIQADLEIITEKELIEKLPDNLSLCLHTASLNDSFIPDYGNKAMQVNVHGTQKLLEAIRQKYTAPPLVIYASTVHVYGAITGIFDETSPVAPKNAYTITHWLAEELCRTYTASHNIPSIIFRCTNGYGAPKILPFGKWHLVFHDLCKMAFQKKKITLQAPPNTVRDFIWMHHVAMFVYTLSTVPYRKHLASATPLHSIAASTLTTTPTTARSTVAAPTATHTSVDLIGETFIIGSGQAHTLLFVAEKIQKAAQEMLGCSIEIECKQQALDQVPELVFSTRKMRKVYKEITGKKWLSTQRNSKEWSATETIFSEAQHTIQLLQKSRDEICKPV